MVRSRRVLSSGNWGKKAAGLALLVSVVALAVSFSTPRVSSVHAASWLDKVFGEFSTTPRSRQRRYRAPAPSYNPRKSQYSKRVKTRSRSKRGRNALGIGKINHLRRKKSKTYRIPKKSRGGTYRTMCVRTCDGYYFPVSFATRKSRLGKDARSCKSSCGSPAKLYYYPNPGGEPEEMVSYRGKKKYKKLKNAFLFRKEFKADCRCQAEPWTDAAKQKHKKYALTETKRKKRLALRKTKSRKKRRKSRRYSRLSKRNRGRNLRRVGAKKRLRKASRRSRPARRRARTSNWSF